VGSRGDVYTAVTLASLRGINPEGFVYFPTAKTGQTVPGTKSKSISGTVPGTVPSEGKYGAQYDALYQRVL